MQRKENGMYELIIDHDFPIHTQMAHKNRGMELSDLVLWNGVLYSFCDYTGLVHEIDLVERKSFPRCVPVSVCLGFARVPGCQRRRENVMGSGVRANAR